MRVAVQEAECGDDEHRHPRGGRSASATQMPSATPESATPASTAGSGMPSRPRNAPSAMIIGKVTGRSHIAGARSCAPHRADRHHRREVIEPGDADA